MHAAECIALQQAGKQLPASAKPDWLNIPSVVYTHPELAWVGDVSGKGETVKTSKFPFMANSRARAVGDSEGGFVKLFTRNKVIIGASIVNSQAGDLLNAVAIAMNQQMTSKQLADISVAHPTLSEAIKEAALADDFKAIHF